MKEMNDGKDLDICLQVNQGDMFVMLVLLNSASITSAYRWQFFISGLRQDNL
jgi:hypothetical protein